jgi:hypothetical protein
VRVAARAGPGEKRTRAQSDAGFIFKLLDVPDDPVGLDVAIPRVELPINFRGGAGNVCRQVDEIGVAAVPNIEEGLLPSATGLQTGEFEERTPLAGCKYARPALNDGLGERELLILDRIDPKIIEASKGLGSRKEADEAFHKGNVGGKVENGIARKVMGLKRIEVEKPAKEL